MYRTKSRCCSVKRCGRARLDRYSRNLFSGLCETCTAGKDTGTTPLRREPFLRRPRRQYAGHFESRMVLKRHYRGMLPYGQSKGTTAAGLDFAPAEDSSGAKRHAAWITSLPDV